MILKIDLRTFVVHVHYKPVLVPRRRYSGAHVRLVPVGRFQFLFLDVVAELIVFQSLKVDSDALLS